MKKSYKIDVGTPVRIHKNLRPSSIDSELWHTEMCEEFRVSQEVIYDDSDLIFSNQKYFYFNLPKEATPWTHLTVEKEYVL